MLDFSKALGQINHDNILLRKMKDTAIDPTFIEWVRSFLSNRKRRVKIGNSTSCYQQVNGGVPQSWWKYVDDTTLSEMVVVNEQSAR